jgi:hypothetical protein
MPWSVLVEPVEGRGDIVYVTDGVKKSVEGRVAYKRLRSSHPLRSFKRQKRIVIERAEAECARLNGGRAP